MKSGGRCPACDGHDVEVAAENSAHTVNTGARVFTSPVRNVLCTTCGLIFNDPMPTEAELSDLYQAMARDVSDRPAASTARIMPIERDQAAFVSRHLGHAPAPRVLDIGCSMGGFLGALAEDGARTVGIEPSPHDAAVARERVGVDVRSGFFEDIEFGAERFDLVSMRFVFEHVREPRALLRRARSLLAGRGLIFIDVPNLAMPFVGLDDFFSYGHLQTFTSGTLSYLCALEGLTPIAIEETRNLFESSPHPPSIRVLLGSSGQADVCRPDVAAVRALVDRYTSARAALAARIDAQLRSALDGRRRVIVYGAGTHTAELWHACPALAAHTIAMVDGNPKLQGHDYLGVPVHSPRDLPALAPDLVVISVRTAEPQIGSWLSGQGLGDITVRLYEHAGVAAA